MGVCSFVFFMYTHTHTHAHICPPFPFLVYFSPNCLSLVLSPSLTIHGLQVIVSEKLFLPLEVQMIMKHVHTQISITTGSNYIKTWDYNQFSPLSLSLFQSLQSALSPPSLSLSLSQYLYINNTFPFSTPYPFIF